MSVEKNWYLICYDIRDQKRWYRVFKKLKGRGDHLQYSIFRVNLTKNQMEGLRWEIAKLLNDEDDLMIVRLCAGCSQNVIDSRESHNWKEPSPSFDIF